MKRAILVCAAAGMAAFAIAGSDDCAGQYRLRPSDETQSLARLMRRPAPEGALILDRDGSFELVYRTVDETTRRFGTYSVDGANLSLSFRDRGERLTGTLGDHCVTLAGMLYARPGYMRMSAPMVQQMAAAQRPAYVYSPPPAPPVMTAQVAPPPPVVRLDLVGCWTVRSNGLEDPNLRMTFDKDGSFSYSGMGARSMGRYEIHDGFVTLIWTQIDDDKVDFGTVKKDVPFGPDGISFQIDTYRYERATH